MLDPLKTLFVDKSIPDVSLERGFESVSRGIGWIAIALPVGCLLAAWSGLMSPLILRDSISHFYYIPLIGDYFVGCLFFIGILLMFFFHTKGNQVSGWGNLYWVETGLLRIGGAASIMIAVFPTLGQGGAIATGERYRTFMPSNNIDFAIGNFGHFDDFMAPAPFIGDIPLHAVGALLMFTILTHFTLFVFTRTQRPDSEIMIAGKTKKTPQKRKRNGVYIALGLTIAACTIAIIYGFDMSGTCDTKCPETPWQLANWTFWLEFIALIAFGIAWLIKGGVVGFLND